MKQMPFIALAMATLPSCGDQPKSQARERDVKRRSGQEMETALENKGLRLGSPAFIRAFKEERELELFVKNKATSHLRLIALSRSQ